MRGVPTHSIPPKAKERAIEHELERAREKEIHEDGRDEGLDTILERTKFADGEEPVNDELYAKERTRTRTAVRTRASLIYGAKTASTLTSSQKKHTPLITKAPSAVEHALEHSDGEDPFFNTWEYDECPESTDPEVDLQQILQPAKDIPPAPQAETEPAITSPSLEPAIHKAQDTPTATEGLSAPQTQIILVKKQFDPSIAYSPSQRSAIQHARAGHNLFITGPAGTGKSAVIAQIIHDCKLKDKNVYVTAPTGMAASLIGGTTIHSFASIGLGDECVNTYVAKAVHWRGIMRRARVKRMNRLVDADVLVIDEISMVSFRVLLPSWAES